MRTDPSTTYLGIALKNPLVVAACPLPGEMDVLRKLEEFGAAAVVMPSLFEEQIEHSAALAAGLSDREGIVPMVDQLAHYQTLKEYNKGPDAYLKHIRLAKLAVSIPIIGSLNVTGPGDACRYATRIQEAGADALEMNIFFLATDPKTTSREVEARYVEVVASVRERISIPLTVKLGPYFTALPNLAARLVEAGANGLVLFNRFLQPEIDLEAMRVAPRLALSTHDELRLALRWIGLLHGRIRCSLAASGGIHFADDVVKLLLAGADVVMVASTLYRHGVAVLQTLVEGLVYWLESNDFQSLEQMKGILSHHKCSDPGVFERANYTKALATFVSLGGVQ
jgi:dihydroorotate dehydrogenase (fumarate)